MFHLGGGGFDLQGHGVADAYTYSDFSSHDFSFGGQNCCPKISLRKVAGDPASLEVCNCGIAKPVVEHVVDLTPLILFFPLFPCLSVSVSVSVSLSLCLSLSPSLSLSLSMSFFISLSGQCSLQHIYKACQANKPSV